jgi:hypothetical protein
VEKFPVGPLRTTAMENLPAQSSRQLEEANDKTSN